MKKYWLTFHSKYAEDLVRLKPNISTFFDQKPKIQKVQTKNSKPFSFNYGFKTERL